MMSLGACSPECNITLNNLLESVHNFNYLGSTITSNLSVDEEINIHIGKADTSFGKEHGKHKIDSENKNHNLPSLYSELSFIWL
jgi:hypothetical protein